MMFDTRIQVFGIEVLENDESVEVQLTVGTGIPGPQGLAALPLGVIRYHLSRDAAIETGQAQLEAGEKIEPPAPESDLAVVTNPSDVEKVAKMTKDIREGATV